MWSEFPDGYKEKRLVSRNCTKEFAEGLVDRYSCNWEYAWIEIAPKHKK